MRKHRAHGLAGGMALIAVHLAALDASANSHGIIGRSGKQGQGAAFTCNATGCHSGGVTPTVSFDGPVQVAPGAIATFTFTVTSKSVNQTAAGFNVAASAGALTAVPFMDSQLLLGELTHMNPKPNVDGVASWQFNWQAPAAPGVYDIFGSGNSVNQNGTNVGDRAASTVIHVEVAEAQPPTPTETAPEPTATDTPVPPTLTPTSTDTPAPPTATATRRDTPVPTATRTPADTPTPTPTATLVPTFSGPQPGDGNCDDVIGAADVIAVEARIGAGSAGACALVDVDCNGSLDDTDLALELARLFGAPVPASCPP